MERFLSDALCLPSSSSATTTKAKAAAARLEEGKVGAARAVLTLTSPHLARVAEIDCVFRALVLAGTAVGVSVDGTSLAAAPRESLLRTLISTCPPAPVDVVRATMKEQPTRICDNDTLLTIAALLRALPRLATSITAASEGSGVAPGHLINRVCEACCGALSSTTTSTTGRQEEEEEEGETHWYATREGRTFVARSLLQRVCVEESRRAGAIVAPAHVLRRCSSFDLAGIIVEKNSNSDKNKKSKGKEDRKEGDAVARAVAAEMSAVVGQVSKTVASPTASTIATTTTEELLRRAGIYVAPSRDDHDADARRNGQQEGSSNLFLAALNDGCFLRRSARGAWIHVAVLAPADNNTHDLSATSKRLEQECLDVLVRRSARLRESGALVTSSVTPEQEDAIASAIASGVVPPSSYPRVFIVPVVVTGEEEEEATTTTTTQRLCRLADVFSGGSGKVRRATILRSLNAASSSSSSSGEPPRHRLPPWPVHHHHQGSPPPPPLDLPPVPLLGWPSSALSPWEWWADLRADVMDAATAAAHGPSSSSSSSGSGSGPGFPPCYRNYVLRALLGTTMRAAATGAGNDDNEEGGRGRGGDDSRYECTPKASAHGRPCVVALDGRENPWTVAAILVTLSNLPRGGEGWAVRVFCGRKSALYYERALAPPFLPRRPDLCPVVVEALDELGVRGGRAGATAVDIDSYNALLKSSGFWRRLTDAEAPACLMVQDDGMLARPGLLPVADSSPATSTNDVEGGDDVATALLFFRPRRPLRHGVAEAEAEGEGGGRQLDLVYDFVGAPWVAGQEGLRAELGVADDEALVGNGGFSLRRPSAMLRAALEGERSGEHRAPFACCRAPIVLPEDVFFCRSPTVRVAPRAVARLFSVEEEALPPFVDALDSEDDLRSRPPLSLGFHKPWAYNDERAVAAFFDRLLRCSIDRPPT